MTFSRAFWSLDFAVASLISIALLWALPHWLKNDLAKDYYGIGISVLSIIFSVFFAALAVIITASDDDFVSFLEETKDYSAIVGNFKMSLGLLFTALIASLVLYGYTASRISNQVVHQSKIFVVLFAFLFTWSLLAALASTLDAIRYSDYRRRFVERKRADGAKIRN
jgi:hypothetical protein